jgi:hypothetical protein
MGLVQFRHRVDTSQSLPTPTLRAVEQKSLQKSPATHLRAREIIAT